MIPHLVILLCILGALAYAALCFYLDRRDRAAGSAPDGSEADTEFTAEVVRVATVAPHPDPETTRLAVATFEMAKSGLAAYEVVVGKDDFRVGDLARYFSVDCVLPLDQPEFAFLRSREHPERTHHRLRAARLRGAYSQGLLVPSKSPDEFGDKLAERCGVSYYAQSTDSEHADQPGHVPRTDTFPAQTYSVHSMKKVMNMFAPEDDVLVTEKVHGESMRFGWIRTGPLKRWKFRVGSHRREVDPDGETLFAQAARLNDLAELTKGAKGAIFFAEVYGKHPSGRAVMAGYDYGQSGPAVRVFDVRHRGRWLTARERSELLVSVGLRDVPFVTKGHFRTFDVVQISCGRSVIDGKTPREGVVVELYDNPTRRVKGKYVGSDYLLAKEKTIAENTAKKRERVTKTGAES